MVGQPDPYDQGMVVELFAGIPVRDFVTALAWYERLFGRPPTMFPHDTEAVWMLEEHRFVYIVEVPERAGHALVTIIVDDLDGVVAQIAERELSPAKTETYGNGVRKIGYHDPDGNEVAFGGLPPS